MTHNSARAEFYDMRKRDIRAARKAAQEQQWEPEPETGDWSDGCGDQPDDEDDEQEQ